VDAERTAQRLLDESPLTPEEAKASLAGLLAIGAIEYVGAPLATSLSTSVARIEITRLASRLGSADPYEVLGLRPEASSDDIRSTYLRLLRFCDPGSTSETEFQSVLQRMSHQLADAFVEIESRRGLRRAASPYRSDAARKRSAGSLTAPPGDESAGATEPLPEPMVKTSAKAAVQGPAPGLDPGRALDASSEAFSAGKHHEALAILHDAIPHLAGRARGAARVRKARVLLAVENGAKLAESELKSALAEDPGNAEAHQALGAIYHQHGSPALAMMEFRKALELQPRNAAARAGLQQLTGAGPDKPQSPRKGFFAR
jgi:tetratricopeptide (TPR) repeat protein